MRPLSRWESVKVRASPAMPGTTIWLTGLSGAGKSTIAEALAERFRAEGRRFELLDGDVIRTHISKGLGFSREDRDTQVRRVGWICGLLNRHGVDALVALISPYRDTRDEVRDSLPRFVEVYVECPLEVLVQRDVKGLYKKARAGEIPEFTGISAPYEEPLSPELTIRTDKDAEDECLDQILGYLEKKGYIPRT